MRPPSNKTLTLLVLSLFFAVLIVRWLDPIRTTDMGSCLTQTLGRFPDIARTDFEIVSVSCDFIAKDESFTIFASRRGRTEKTPLFKYTPANVELPVISARDEHTVVISAWNVSSTFFSVDRWEDLAIKYDLDPIEYPSKNDPKLEDRRGR